MTGEQIKAQEYKFVEWSETVTRNTYDLSKIIQVIQDRFGDKPFKVLDVGGGIGAVAGVICDSLAGAHVDVLDCSHLAKKFFESSAQKKLIFEDFFEFLPVSRYDVVIFRTVLHHFVGNSERETIDLQSKALSKARSEVLADGGIVFVVENFYEPLFGKDITGRLIFELTRLKGPDKIFRKLGANTAGEGVRFRSSASWTAMFRQCGYVLEPDTAREDWGMPLWQRVPFVCKKRFQALVVLRNQDA